MNLAALKRWTGRGAAAALLLSLGGCVAVGSVAAMLHRTGSHTVSAEYAGLAGKKVAVVVDADRVIQGNFPTIVAELSNGIAARLGAESGLEMTLLSPADIVRFQLNNPRWAAMPYDELAEKLGAERIVLVEVYEFRLHEPGNQWVWDGLAAGRVGVLEADGPIPEEFIYATEVSVKFPDLEGTGPETLTGAQVAAVLRKRFVDRVIWLFFEHEEKNFMEY